MKEISTGILAFILWVALTWIVGHYANIMIHSIGANRISVGDVIGCYAIPAVLLGISILFGWAYLNSKK